MANEVVVHPNQYRYADETISKKSFMQKYLTKTLCLRSANAQCPSRRAALPELTKIYERRQVKPRGPKKVVVFDLDETIGSFGDLYALWQSLPNTSNRSSDYDRFKPLLDLYPEFFRPGIFPIIEYIYRKIERGISHPIHVYTNNQCDAPNWVAMILRYIEGKMGRNGRGRLFADPICAFKIGGRRVNLKRTTPHKTPADFVRCSVIPRGAEICFIDDQTHEQMKTKKIYYIQPPPYRHPLRREMIMDRFERSAEYANYFSYRNNAGTNKPGFAEGRLSPSGQVFAGVYSVADERIGRKILFYVREFFLSELPPTSSRTRKHRGHGHELTRTKRSYST